MLLLLVGVVDGGKLLCFVEVFCYFSGHGGETGNVYSHSINQYVHIIKSKKIRQYQWML